MHINYGWRFVIADQDELLDWWSTVQTTLFKEGFVEYRKLAGATSGHARTPYGYLLSAYQELHQERSFVDNCAALSQKILLGMQSLLAGGRIFIAGNGSYFSEMPDLKVGKLLKVESWILPGEQITIQQWPDGHHYYAKVGQQQVEWEGQIRWDNEYAARKAAEEFQAKMEREGS